MNFMKVAVKYHTMEIKILENYSLTEHNFHLMYFFFCSL